MNLLIGIAVGALAWPAVAWLLAVVLGRAIHEADDAPYPDADDDLMAMVQPENDPGRDDREFHALTDPIEAEIARRWTA